jgi:outer membrane protein assembly factor BamB
MMVVTILFLRRNKSYMKSKRVLLVLVIALAAVLLSGCSRTGFTNSWPGLTTDGETAYLAAGQYVYAIRLSDGREVWRYPAKASTGLQFIAQPVIAPDGTILLGSAGSDHRLVAIDPARIDVETNSPEETWIFSGAADRWIAAPLVLEDKVFAPNTDGTLYVISLQDGLASKAAEREIELGGSLWAQPVSDGKLVYIPAMNHSLYAINPDTYEIVWSALQLGGAIPGSPLVTPESELIVGSFASEVVKISSTTGAVTPFISTKGWVWGSPVLVGDAIFFGDLDGYFYAIRPNGEQLWSIQPDGPIVGSPLVMPEYIVFATESGSVYAVDQDGKIVWQREVGGQIYTSPVTGADRILIAPMQAEFLMAALDVNGNQVWNFKPEN